MLKKLLAKRQEGFTLIEIVLVLAIAGLIMVIVFAAVSGAQAARRDTKRRSDVARLRAEMENYGSNNAGSYPAAAVPSASLNSYLGTFNDPDGTAYVVNVYSGTGTTPTAPTAKSGTIAIGVGRICKSPADGTTIAGSGLRQYSVQYFLEQGGLVCADNQ